jgi:hypothetical protein
VMLGVIAGPPSVAGAVSPAPASLRRVYICMPSPLNRPRARSCSTSSAATLCVWVLAGPRHRKGRKGRVNQLIPSCTMQLTRAGLGLTRMCRPSQLYQRNRGLLKQGGHSAGDTE